MCSRIPRSVCILAIVLTAGLAMPALGAAQTIERSPIPLLPRSLGAGEQHGPTSPDATGTATYADTSASVGSVDSLPGEPQSPVRASSDVVATHHDETNLNADTFFSARQRKAVLILGVIVIFVIAVTVKGLSSL